MAEDINSSYLEFFAERTYIMGPKKRIDRIYRGKPQRRKVFSNRPGYTIRRGKLMRMSPSEVRRRQISQRRAARKRKAKQSRTLQKRRISLMKRKTLGF